MVAVPQGVSPGEFVPTADQRVSMALDWSGFESLLAGRGDMGRPRLAYLDGVLELMSPSKDHDRIAFHISQMITVFALERGIDVTGFKSWTLKHAASATGVEPDNCFIVGGETDKAIPDLAIEVNWTRGGIDKLEIYRRLGIGEVWFWEAGRIDVYVRSDDGYERRDASACLPGLDLALICALADSPTTTAAIRAFRDALRG